MTIAKKFQTLVDEAFPGKKLRTATLNKLHGDASCRAYYRLTVKDGRTFVVMQLPDCGASASEEITNFSGKLSELPFQNVQRFLKSLEIPVPEILHYAPELHLMLLEDCGDMILFHKVAKAHDNERMTWYTRAIDLLCNIQRRSETARPEHCVALQRSFDATLLNWEFAHFVEYAIEARAKKPLPVKVRQEFNRITGHITDTIMELPYGFTHRDYQSRNLLVHHDRLVVIDFQDALRGPFIYDMVALLRDSYVDLCVPLVEHLLEQYAQKRGIPLSEVRRAFDLVTVQRKLKDAGRFVYIDHVKKNHSYLKFIPTSLGYVREALGRMREGPRLFELLKPYVPEWNT